MRALTEERIQHISIQQNQLKLLDYLEGKCCDTCKEDDPGQLRFINLKTKREIQVRKFIASGMAWGTTYQKAEACTIKCKTCIKSKSKSTIKAKRHNQLGMNASTASSRLVKDILFNFVVEAGLARLTDPSNKRMLNMGVDLAKNNALLSLRRTVYKTVATEDELLGILLVKNSSLAPLLENILKNATFSRPITVVPDLIETRPVELGWCLFEKNER